MFLPLHSHFSSFIHRQTIEWRRRPSSVSFQMLLMGIRMNRKNKRNKYKYKNAHNKAAFVFKQKHNISTLFCRFFCYNVL
ncbi:unnamed protein product [Meloidogyne enterolobii]|uniref:Uncharacterized protein n=1 Tax=Meloidogyne enterolobii TaxID=390850 RepID=A0ACB0XKA6_MELEN